MSNWRPKDWQNPYTKESTNPWVTRDFAVWSRIHEQGATNMLEAISEELKEIKNPYDGTTATLGAGFDIAIEKVLEMLGGKDGN